MKDTYICKQCGDQLKGQRRKFCSDECGQSWIHAQNRMDFGTGMCHNDTVTYDQRVDASAIQTLHVPHEILEEAKVYTDCRSGGYCHPLGYKMLDDYEEINQAVYMLNEFYPKKYRKVKSKEKQLKNHVPGISRKDFN